MKIPNLFIAGLPRSGTSSLHDYLGQHPEIFMTAIKEPNYFAPDFHKESDAYHHKQLYFPYRTKDQYLRLYKNWHDEKIAGEASWTSLYSKMAAREIRQFNPNAKIIIALREPVSFLYSYHSAAAFALGESIQDFKQALSVETERKNGKYLGKRIIVPSWLFYSDFVRYADHVQRYVSVFSNDQMKIILFDDFKQNTAGVYNTILTFLDVSCDFNPEFNIVNPNKILKWPRLKKLILDSPYFRNTLRFFISDNTYAALKKLYKDRVVTYEARGPLDDDIKNELMVNFRGEVEKLSHLVDKDLIALWGYDRI
jgi:hypothetical protein